MRCNKIASLMEMSKGLCSYDKEFNLLDSFQKIDSSKFNVWNYRRRCFLHNVPEEEELEYTADMIGTKFHNYSTWHSWRMTPSGCLFHQTIRRKHMRGLHTLNFLKQMTFRSISSECIKSESAEGGADMKMLNWGDRSFHALEMPSQELSQFLSLDQLSFNSNHEAIDSRWLAETLENEIAQILELLFEDNCKIGKLTLAKLLMTHKETMTCTTADYEKVNTEEILENFSDLMKSDPTHSRYYKDKRSKF